LSGFEVVLVKQNPKRKVYRLHSPGKPELYLKLFAGQGALLSFFRFYAAGEYRAARRLELLGLPVIRYLAWGCLREGGFCLSEGIPDAVPARRYFFESLIREPWRQADFLDQLADVSAALRRHRIRHPDFHLGNILYCQLSGKLFLADPWGIHPVPFWRGIHQIELCLPWLELYGSIPEDMLLQGIQNADLASDGKAARNLLTATRARHDWLIRRHWKKLSARILSGKSKFATEVVLPEGRCSFRHTEWFAPPEKLEVNPSWKSIVYENEAESEKIWLDSFLQIPPLASPPLARLIRKDGASVLFYNGQTC
ncbi:MAG: hypothetical protein J5858_14615, partial [Lentisphaeria bacterium]|nr:hypothetical protein [Lentisphaeria bacterium]